MFLSKNDDPFTTVLATREPKPIHPNALSALPLIDAMAEVTRAEKALEKAKDEVPDYTGQWRDRDYWAQEQDDYNRAVEKVALALGNMGVISPPSFWSEEAPSPFQTVMSQTIEQALPDLQPKERKYCEGLVYLGDLVTKLDKASGFVSVLSGKTGGVLRDIPARQGLEDWVRPS